MKYSPIKSLRYLRRTVFYVFLFCSNLFYSCEFQPWAIPETKVERPSEIAPMITAEITPDTDTLKLYQPTTIKYRFAASPRKVVWVEFNFDGTDLFRRDYITSEPMEIDFNPGAYNEGLHTLTISVFTSSNSGSIADKVGAEGYLYQLQWPVIIDRTPLKALEVYSADSVAGGVRIVWEKFNHASFEYYKLVKHSYTTNQSTDLAVITSPHQNYFTDDSYLEGEEAIYRVWLGGHPGNSMGYLRLPIPPLVTPVDVFSAKVEWQKPINIDLLDYYYFHTKSEDFVIREENKIYEKNVTSKIFNNLSFGQEYNFAIKYVPVSSSPGFNFYGIHKAETSYFVGDRMPEHHVSRAVGGKNEIFLANYQKLYHFNLSTKTAIDSLLINFDKRWSFDVSFDGKYFGYSENGEFVLRKTEGLEFVNKVSKPVYTGNSDNLYLFTISNNKKLLSVQGDGLLQLINLESGEQIAEEKLAYGRSYSKISPDGNFALAKKSGDSYFQYYKLTDTGFTEVAVVDDLEIDYYDYFVFGSENQIYLFSDGLVQIREGENFNIINELALPQGYIDAIDVYNEQLLLIDGGIGKIISTNSGDILSSFNIAPSGFNSIHNNYITSEHGSFLGFKGISSSSSSSASVTEPKLVIESNNIPLK